MCNIRSVGVSNGRQRPRLCGSSAQFVAKLAASPSRTVVTAVQVGQLSSLSPRSFGSSFALRTSRISTSVGVTWWACVLQRTSREGRQCSYGRRCVRTPP